METADDCSVSDDDESDDDDDDEEEEEDDDDVVVPVDEVEDWGLVLLSWKNKKIFLEY